MYLTRFEGISVATGNKLLWCHVDRGNCASPGFNVNLYINQCIHDGAVNGGNNNEHLFCRMYAGAYSKAACYYVLNKEMQLNNFVDALKKRSSLPE